MASIDTIKDTTMQGLSIGVFAGVSGGLMKNINKMFKYNTKTTKRKKRRKKRK